MNDRERHLSPDEVTQTTKTLRLAGQFFRDVLDDPAVLEEIPNDAALAFTEVSIPGYRLRLTASQPAVTNAEWTACVSGYIEGRSASPAPGRVSRPNMAAVATGATAAAALGALEEKLRVADLAVRQARGA